MEALLFGMSGGVKMLEINRIEGLKQINIV